MAEDIWCLDSSQGTWLKYYFLFLTIIIIRLRYVLETNYDHWKDAPWFDDRRRYAKQGMDSLGQEKVSLAGMLDILGTKPVLNQMTTYSVLLSAQNGTMQAWNRYCSSPCPE